MKLHLTDIEVSLLRESLMDTATNSDNFSETEKEFLLGIYSRVKLMDELRRNGYGPGV